MSCCQSLTLPERSELAARGFVCGEDRCARVDAAVARQAEQEVAAELSAGTALRCAWLRVHAEDLRPFDPSGQLSAQLRDFADLLELVDAKRWMP